jgi:hypothetical protein
LQLGRGGSFQENIQETREGFLDERDFHEGEINRATSIMTFILFVGGLVGWIGVIQTEGAGKKPKENYRK